MHPLFGTKLLRKVKELGLNSNDVHVLLILADHDFKDSKTGEYKGEVWPGMEGIAASMGKSRRAVSTIISRLAGRGHILRNKQGRNHNRYSLNPIYEQIELAIELSRDRKKTSHLNEKKSSKLVGKVPSHPLEKHSSHETEEGETYEVEQDQHQHQCVVDASELLKSIGITGSKNEELSQSCSKKVIENTIRYGKMRSTANLSGYVIAVLQNGGAPPETKIVSEYELGQAEARAFQEEYEKAWGQFAAEKARECGGSSWEELCKKAGVPDSIVGCCYLSDETDERVIVKAFDQSVKNLLMDNYHASIGAVVGKPVEISVYWRGHIGVN
jgi:predicted transcriptional regulator